MTLSKIISIYYVRHHWNGFLRHRHSYLRMNGNLPMKMFLLNSGYCYYFLKEKKSYCYAENFHYNYYKNGKNCYSLRVPYTGDSKNGKNPNRLHFHERSVYTRTCTPPSPFRRTNTSRTATSQRGCISTTSRSSTTDRCTGRSVSTCTCIRTTSYGSSRSYIIMSIR